MKQVIYRRFNKQQDADKIPDILFIDGGLGQLRQAESVLSEPPSLANQKTTTTYWYR